jgi:L-asparaginase II
MNPVLVEVLRGDRVESWHRGATVACDATGRIVTASGDIERAIYPRSTVKPLQALPLVASGAADWLGLSDTEIALACGSHAGEPLHVATAEGMLGKAGRDASCLECGVHWPLSESAARDLAARGASPTPLHNNCSGKHAGFICLACYKGLETSGYGHPDHPIMQEVTAALAAATSARLDPSCRGVDGCSIPTYAMPLKALATGFARLGTGQGLPMAFELAASRIRRAVAANSFALAGTGRFDTRVTATYGTAILCKSGAEGVVAASIPAMGLGIAVKIDDGAGRAAEVAMAALLRRILPDSLSTDDLPLTEIPLFNWNGVLVGRIKAC